MSYRGLAVGFVFESVVRKRGYEPSVASLSTGERGNIADLVTLFCREAFEGEWWPESLVVEQRQYRATWDVLENYGEGDEVLQEDADEVAHYWRSLVDSNVGNDPATDDGTNWESADTDLERTIALDQAWASTVIGRLDVQRDVFAVDPRVNRDALPLRDVYLLGDTILVRTEDAPARPWVRFQLRAPEFSWAEWSAATAYGIGELVYVSTSGGTPVRECFVALQASTNRQPFTEVDFWASVPFPWFLRDYVIHAVAAEEMREDEARFKERSLATKVLEGLRERVMEGQGQRRRAIR